MKYLLTILFIFSLPCNGMGKYEFDQRVWETEAEFSIYWHDYKHACVLIKEHGQTIRAHFWQEVERQNDNFNGWGKPNEALRKILEERPPKRKGLDQASDIESKLNRWLAGEKGVVTTLNESVRRRFEQGDLVGVDESYGHVDITVLIDAAAQGNLANVNFFLDKGADINKSDRVGNTALSTALYNRQYEVALCLLKRGAKKYIDMEENSSMKVLTSQKLLHKQDEWPKELLIELQGECPICLEDIDEVGNIYNCGHSVHHRCKTETCPFCQK